MVSSICCAIILPGDFNNVGTDCSFSNDFLAVLESFSSIQHIDFLTGRYLIGFLHWFHIVFVAGSTGSFMPLWSAC